MINNRGFSDNNFLLFLKNLPLSHALARAAECQVLSSFKLKPPVLDIGCGEGIFSQICFGKKKIDVGLDKNPKEIKIARKRKVYKKTIVGDAVNLPFADNSFNTVISNCTFEHIENVARAIAEVNRVLKKGGKFIFTVPTPQVGDYLLLSLLFNRLGLKPISRAYSRLRNKFWRHIYLKNQKWWTSQLRKNGFTKIEGFQFAPKKVTAICDFFTIFSFPAYLIKRKTGNWRIWRPKWITKIFFYFLNKLYLGKSRRGATFVFQAEK